MSIDEERVQFMVRCRFNGYCKKVIRNKAMDLKKRLSSRWNNEIFLEDLSPFEQAQLSFVDNYFDDGIVRYVINGKNITEELIHEAIRSLPDNKQMVINLYYFDDLSEREIAEMLNISRNLVKYRKSTSLEKLKKYLEEHADEEE